MCQRSMEKNRKGKSDVGFKLVGPAFLQNEL